MEIPKKERIKSNYKIIVKSAENKEKPSLRIYNIIGVRLLTLSK